jgi:hypothetical protein
MLPAMDVASHACHLLSPLHRRQCVVQPAPRSLSRRNICSAHPPRVQPRRLPEGAVQVSGRQGGIGVRPARWPRGLRRAVAPHCSRAAVAIGGPSGPSTIFFFHNGDTRFGRGDTRRAGVHCAIAILRDRHIATKTALPTLDHLGRDSSSTVFRLVPAAGGTSPQVGGMTRWGVGEAPT